MAITFTNKPGQRDVNLFHCYRAREERKEFEAIRNRLDAAGDIASESANMIITHDGERYRLS